MQRPRNPEPGKRILCIALAALPLLGLAQDKVPVARPRPETAPAAGTPPPGEAPPAAPAEAVRPPEPLRDIAASPEKVRAALLEILAQEGLPLSAESSDAEVVTEFVVFAPDRFGPDVALPPPAISPTFPFYQKHTMNTGKLRLRALLEPAGEGCRVRLTALLMADAFNRATYERTEIPRDSNGRIEKHFLDALTARLEPGAPQTAPSH